jgi:ATP-dependent Clp protease protease subunit
VSYYVPIVLENTGRGERSMDIYSRLLKDRIIFIGTPIYEEVANVVIAQMLFLQMEDPQEGQSTSTSTRPAARHRGHGDLRHDELPAVRCRDLLHRHGRIDGVRVLLAAGTKGKRFALPNRRVMIHQPSGGASGQTADSAIQAKEILRWRSKLNEILSRHSGKAIEQIEKDSDRDYYMSAQEALAYGIVDKVFETKNEVASTLKAVA